jgi:prephenate dehydratase/chorismate mutase/prephenate dehydratase
VIDVAYLGPAGTFTDQATRVLAPEGRHLPMSSSREVVVAVASGAVDLGVVPIDNSIEGPVAPSIDALLDSDAYVVGMAVVPISFHAFAANGAGRAVAAKSHPHALAQCSAFLRDRGLESRVAASTAAACVDLGPDEIALAPSLCGDLYGLETVATDVQDFANGWTRFVLVADRDGALAGERLALADRTILTVVPADRGRGVLARITTVFADAGYDLEGLVLRPLKTPDFSYVFMLTVASHPHERGLVACLEDLVAAGDRVRMIGFYRATAAALGEGAGVALPQTARLGASSAGELRTTLLLGDA